MFRGPLSDKSRKERKNWKDPLLKGKKQKVKIEHNRVVKYLGVYIDDRLHFSQHIKAQRKKAVAVFGKLHNLFYNKYLSSKIKIIAYLCLIRPILTYACPVWFDISPNAMVGLRKLERKILRACLNKYRQPESNFWKFISNVELYKLANIPRIDVFIIKLIRNHIKEAIKNKENPLIYSPFFPNPQYHKRCMKSGFMPPEVFKAVGYRDTGNMRKLQYSFRFLPYLPFC